MPLTPKDCDATSTDGSNTGDGDSGTSGASDGGTSDGSATNGGTDEGTSGGAGTSDGTPDPNLNLSPEVAQAYDEYFNERMATLMNEHGIDFNL